MNYLTDKKAFAKNMAAKRVELGWTQERAAKAIGITKSILGAYEEGRTLPKVDKLMKIVKRYKIKDVVGFITSDELSSIDNNEITILKKYYALPDKEKKAVDVLLGVQ
jgi:transcriptional regulator with XRE-family HTH domain